MGVVHKCSVSVPFGQTITDQALQFAAKLIEKIRTVYPRKTVSASLTTREEKLIITFSTDGPDIGMSEIVLGILSQIEEFKGQRTVEALNYAPGRCAECHSRHIAAIVAQCNDCCYVEYDGKSRSNYVPSGLGLRWDAEGGDAGPTDVLSFRLCLNCGHVQGMWPKQGPNQQIVSEKSPNTQNWSGKNVGWRHTI